MPDQPLSSHPGKLLRSRRFGPFFATMFLGSFNDNLFKNTLILMIVYQAASDQSTNVNQLTNLAAGLFILPYLLFSALAGQLADRYEKSAMIRYLKLAEVMLMVATAVALQLQSLTLLMVLLFFMATQSTLFSPIKFSLIPQHLERPCWVAGNGLIEAGTFTAILLGTLLAGVIYPLPQGLAWVSVLICIQAVAGWWISRRVPLAPSVAPDTQPDFHLLRSAVQLTRTYWGNRSLRLLIVCNSWFWFIGASYLTQIPYYARSVLGGDPTTVSWLLGCLTIGIGAGSMLCNRLKRDPIGRDMTCIGLLGMTLAGADLAMAGPALPHAMDAGLTTLLSSFSGLRVSIDVILIGVAGGLYIVPLCTQFQDLTDGRDRARAFAVANIFNALFMIASAALGFILLGVQGWTVPAFFALLAGLNLLAMVLICAIRPDWLHSSLQTIGLSRSVGTPPQ